MTYNTYIMLTITHLKRVLFYKITLSSFFNMLMIMIVKHMSIIAKIKPCKHKWDCYSNHLKGTQFVLGKTNHETLAPVMIDIIFSSSFTFSLVKSGLWKGRQRSSKPSRPKCSRNKERKPNKKKGNRFVSRNPARLRVCH